MTILSFLWTIDCLFRLPIKEFTLSKSQKKVLKKAMHFLTYGMGEHCDKRPKPENTEKSLKYRIEELLGEFNGKKHQFTVTLERASITDESFELYRKYQKHVHHDDSENPICRKGFGRFLVNTPLKVICGDIGIFFLI